MSQSQSSDSHYQDPFPRPSAAGAVAVIEESELIMKSAGIEPKFTAVAPSKPEPVMVTAAPPLVIYAFLMDYYIAGLTAGATKG